MKILFSSDWQARLSNLDLCEKVVDQVCQEIDQHKVDYFFHAGDWKDPFNPVDVRVTNFLIHAIETIRKHCPVLTIIGNHDRSGPHDHLPEIGPVLRSAGAQVFDKPTNTLLGGWSIYAVPYIRDPKELQKALAVPPTRGKTILVFHNSLRGCDLSVLRKEPEGIAPDGVLNKFEICIGGHVHYQQFIPPNIWYVGSPFPQDWGEANQQKGFLLVTLTDHKAEVLRINSTLPLWWDPAWPKFDRASACAKPCHIRIRIPYESPEQFARETKHAQSIYSKAQLHVVPVYDQTALSSPEGAKFNTDQELIEQYLAHNPSLTTEPKAVAVYLANRLHKTGIADVFQIKALKFKECWGQNVLSFARIGYKLDRPGITLVTAENRDWPGHSNGGGKTNALSIPGVAMFGCTVKGQEHNEWALRGQHKALAGIELELHNKRSMIIERHRPSGLRLRVDGRDMEMGDWRASQRLIESLTNLSWDVLTNAIYISQREVGTILTGKPKERQELFSRFLGLERFIKALELVRKDLNRCERAIEELEDEIQFCQQSAASTLEALKTTTISITKQEYLKKFAVLKRKAADERQEKKECEIQKSKLEKIAEGRDDLVTHKEKALAVAFARCTDTREAIAKLTNLAGNPTCPACGGAIDKASLGKHKQELQAQLLKLEASARSQSVILSTEREQRGKIQIRLQYYVSTILNRRINISRLQSDIQNLNEHRRKAREAEAVAAGIRGKAEEWKRKQELHEMALEAYREDYKRLDTCASIVGREGLPAFLCSRVCPQLNKAALELSEGFSDGEIQIQFAIVDGCPDATINNLHGGESIKDQSQGEAHIAGLIAALAFRKVLVPYSLLMIDEPAEGCDSESSRAIGQYLTQVATQFGSVFITTHNPNLLAALEPQYHIQIVKENGVSSII